MVVIAVVITASAGRFRSPVSTQDQNEGSGPEMGDAVRADEYSLADKRKDGNPKKDCVTHTIQNEGLNKLPAKRESMHCAIKKRKEEA